MYKKLLISAGGGIVANSQKAGQNECATIAIGLGGTGIACLRALKKQVYNTLQPDDKESVVPEYKHIKFLAVDTDPSSLVDNGSIDTLDTKTEFFDLSCPAISDKLENGEVLRGKNYLRWLMARSTQDNGKGIDILSAEAGAGGIPQIGRLLLLEKSSQFVNRITGMIKEAITDLPKPELNIHIFTGLGGGTGAGTFLDVCYMVQYALSTMGLGSIAQTCGFFFLPDVNIDNVPNEHIGEYVKVNGFAKMKELDYCMNLETNGGEWNQQYDGFSYKTQKPPVKLAHLITATAEDGAIVTNAYNYAMKVVVEYVMDFMSKPVYTPVEGEESPFTLKSHISNITGIIGKVNKDYGACYNYCVLGASNAYLPYKDITTYLASKIFDGFGNLDKQLPSEADLTEFVSSTSLKYKDIYQGITNGAKGIPVLDIDASSLYDAVQGLSSNTFPGLLEPMNDAKASIFGTMESNKKALLDDFAGKKAEEHITSLITRIDTKLKEISGQADKGPYYAGALLHNLSAKDLLNVISGYKTETEVNLNQERANMSLREQSYAQALSRLQNAGKMKRKKYASEFVGAFHAELVERVKIHSYEVMQEVLTELEKQISDLYAQYYSVFAQIMQELEQTFKSNLEVLSEHKDTGKEFAIKLMSMDDLKESLDATVEKMQIEDLIHGFIKYMFENSEFWIAQDENKIAHSVSSFFIKELEKYTSMTVSDYLKIKFDTNNLGELSKKVYDQIIMPVSEKSKPMFWVDNVKYSLEKANELILCTIPQTSQEIKDAVDSFKSDFSNKTIQIRPSYSPDRISFLNFRCGVPMVGYKGVEQYKGGNEHIGAYCYEGSIGDSRDWRKLYDLTPFSCMEKDTLTEDVQKKSKTFDKAKEMNIVEVETINEDNDDYYIRIFNEKQINKFVVESEEIINSKDVVKIGTFLKENKNVRFDIEESRMIKKIGTKGHEETSIKDLVMASPVFLDMLDKEIIKREKVQTLMKQMESIVEDSATNANAAQVFASALCTGVISNPNDYTYVYEKEEYGIKEEIEITTIEKEPYGEQIPLYSAYLGFMNLDKEMKEEIAKAVRERKVNHGDEVKIIQTSVKEKVSGDNANRMIAKAQQHFPGETQNVITFFKNLSFEIENF